MISYYQLKVVLQYSTIGRATRLQVCKSSIIYYKKQLRHTDNNEEL